MHSTTVIRKFKLFMAVLGIISGLVIVTFYTSDVRLPVPSTSRIHHGFPDPPTGKIHYGVQLNHGFDDITDYAQRLGSTPALYGRYSQFPLSSEEQEFISSDVEELASLGASMMLTLDPRGGLATVTPQALQELTENLIEWNRQGVPVLVRFGHEMNGSWYAWGQQPDLYIEKFRQVADTVHEAPSSAILWSPNEGADYPFHGGAPYAAKPGSADAHALDTDGDGELTEADDPYSPYWPGEDVVDWVGLTVYHYGEVYPWGENTVPEPGKLAAKIDGTFKSAHADDTGVPDFYADYAERYDKPFAISETGAFFNTSRSDGASGLAIKRAWWEQLYDPELHKRYPRLQLAAWFEHSKVEMQPGNPVIDWRTTIDSATREPFVDAIPEHFNMAPLE